MSKIKKTYRLGTETLSELDNLATMIGAKSQTEALEYAIRNCHTLTEKVSTEPYAHEKVLDVLTEQLSVKDEQIRSLSQALEAAQDTARAAQTLHGAEVLPKAIDTAEKPRDGFWRRLWRS